MRPVCAKTWSPQDATAVFISPEADKIEQAFAAFLENNPVKGTITVEGEQVTIELIGKAAHGMNPAAGVNAGTYLATFLNKFNFGGQAATFLELIADRIHLQHDAQKLNLAYTDPVMGELDHECPAYSLSRRQTGGEVALNFRYPQGVSEEGIEIKLEAALASYGVTIAKRRTRQVAALCAGPTIRWLKHCWLSTKNTLA